MKEINELLDITKKLRTTYKKYDKQFTLDGKLVGDIGEVLAAEKYGLKLYGENEQIHDGEEIKTGRKVQIKSSFKGYCYFPYDHVPEYFLSLKIEDNGELIEQFNGPGAFIKKHYIEARGLKHYKKSYYTLSKGVLKELNERLKKEAPSQRIQEVK